MRKMCVISKNGKKILLAIALLSLWSITSIAQDKSDIQRLDQKIDSVLKLLQNVSDQVSVGQDSLKKDCTEEIVILEKKHQQELEKLQKELQNANLNADKLQKENLVQQDKITQATAQAKKEIEAVLDQIMVGGTSIGTEGLNYFLEVAKNYKADNLQKMLVFAGLFNEVMQLEQEFNNMIDFQKVKSTAEVLKFKVAAYPGLHQAVHNILFKLKNYCDYEQKLMDAIALSLTQSSEENRKKQLLRREDDFTDYPYLKAEMEKAKANKDYKPTPKCN